MTLRTAVVDDIPGLVELAREFYDEDGFTTPDTMLHRNFEELIESSGAHIMAASKEGRLCGFALTSTTYTLESGVVAELQDLFVRPEARRQGVASALITEAAEWARARGATVLEIVIAPNGRDVSHLFRYYAARGFVDEGRRILGRAL